MRECSMHAMGIARGNRPSGLRSADGWERVHARIISGIWQRAPVADACFTISEAKSSLGAPCPPPIMSAVTTNCEPFACARAYGAGAVHPCRWDHN